MPKAKTRDNILSEKEVKDLIKASAESLRESFIVNVLLSTGMRVGEFVHMRKDWVDFTRGVIRIPEEMPCDCKDCKDGVWRPKTNRAARIIPIASEIRPLLKNFFRAFNSVGQSIPSPSSAYYHLQKAAKRAKIPHKVFPHALRGTFATMFIVKSMRKRKSVNVFTLQDLMGWASIETANQYVRLSGEVTKQSFEEIW